MVLAKLKPGHEPSLSTALPSPARAATVALGDGAGVLLVGCAQTPTRALVVRRDELVVYCSLLERRHTPSDC